jgi:hypothetical protein
VRGRRSEAACNVSAEGLSGKAVALDLFTFFALDTPLEYRPR